MRGYFDFRGAIQVAAEHAGVELWKKTEPVMALGDFRGLGR
jgi:hypothetical protein